MAQSVWAHLIYWSAHLDIQLRFPPLPSLSSSHEWLSARPFSRTHAPPVHTRTHRSSLLMILIIHSREMIRDIFRRSQNITLWKAVISRQQGGAGMWGRGQRAPIERLLVLWLLSQCINITHTHTHTNRLYCLKGKGWLLHSFYLLINLHLPLQQGRLWSGASTHYWNLTFKIIISITALKGVFPTIMYIINIFSLFFLIHRMNVNDEEPLERTSHQHEY